MLLTFAIFKHGQIKVIEVSHEVKGVVLILLKLIINLESIGRRLELLLVSGHGHRQRLTLIIWNFVKGLVVDHGFLPHHCLPAQAPLTTIILLHVNRSQILPASTPHLVRGSEGAHPGRWDHQQTFLVLQ